MKERLDISSIKLEIKKSEYFPDRSEYVRDNMILNFMEWKMKKHYNRGKLSKYRPNNRECEVMARNLYEMIKFRKYEFPSHFDFNLLKSIYDDISLRDYPLYNKRAWITCIDHIKRYWMKRCPEYIVEKSI